MRHTIANLKLATVLIALVLSAIMLLTTACESAGDKDPGKSESAARETETMRNWEGNTLQQSPAARSTMPAKLGPAPLVYIVEQAASVRVIDVTDNRRLAEGNVPSQGFVRIDQESGVHLGKLNLLRGPLPAGHRYAIYVDHGGQDVYRNEVRQLGGQR